MALLTDYLPDFNINTSSIVFVISMFIIAIIVIIVIGFGLYLYFQRRKYKNKLVIFERIGKSIEPTRKDRGAMIPLGNAGDLVMYALKNKKYLAYPQIQTGKNTYWFFIREDGEWINIGIEDIDVLMRSAKVHYLEKEMRYARVALQRNLQDRYQKTSFWAKYGGLVAYIALIAVTGIMMWLLFDKYLDIANTNSAAIEASKSVIQETQKLVGSLNQLKGTGALTPAV